jgi:hypothetical protein
MPIVNSFDVAALQAAIINQINASSTATAAALDVQAAKLDETKAGLDSSINGAVDSISNAVSAVGTAVNNVNDSVTSKSVIKSIQRGVVSFSDRQDIDVTIAAVDPTKAFVNTSCKNSASTSGSYFPAGDKAIGSVAGAQLVSATQLSIHSASMLATSNQNTGQIYWEVIEYA